ncbi:MAG: S8 family peptidase [Luteolibacter sp.]
MNHRLRLLYWMLGFVLFAMFGYWLAGTARLPPLRSNKEPEPVAAKLRSEDDAGPRFRSGERDLLPNMDGDAIESGAIANERVVMFRDRDALEDFLRRAKGRVHIKSRLDALNSLRVGFQILSELESLLGEDDALAMIFPVMTPPLPEGGVQADAVALGNRLPDWLGIAGDHTSFGRGVKIAVLDTGVAQHPAIGSLIQSINLVEFPADGADLNGHGTAVASMIVGQGDFTPGVAPAAEIISVRVADDLGQSDSFLLAQGIVAAVDAGGILINVSMGSFGRSAVLDQAIEYALGSGALIFAAAGNNGIDQVFYPAANEGVIAVGAVDALGSHLEFSNTGAEIDVSAPGYSIHAAWPGDQAARVSGTSFSTPIVAGAVAAVMTEAGAKMLSPAQAWGMLAQHLNDTGSAGADPQYGAGMPDLGRVFNASKPGIYDAAVASLNPIQANAGHPNGQLEVLIQNRGTETMVNSLVEIQINGRSNRANITSLAPNEVTTVRVPLVESSGGIEVNARVGITGDHVDIKPDNNSRSAVID